VIVLGRRWAAIFTTTIAATALFGIGKAAAQTGYPPAPPTTVLCTAGNIDAGTVGLGQTITITLCGPFQPGSTVAVNVGATQIATAVGAVTVTVTGATCGANDLVATGPGEGAATATSTATFTVTCARPSSSADGLAFTGANIYKYLLAALVLIAIGAMLVLLHRRRAA